MTTIRKLILSAAILSVGATGYSVAQEPSETAPPAASQPADDNANAADADAGAPEREGRRAGRRNLPVSEEDFGTRRIERLSQADTDGDGELSRAEIEEMALQRLIQRRADRMERRLDIDGDGTVTIAEVENHQAKRFAYLDRNEDGELDRAEMRRADREKGGKGGHHRGGRGHHERMKDGGPRGER